MAGKALRFPVVFRGETKVYTFTARDSDGQPVDLSGASEVDFSVNYPVGPPYDTAISKSLGGGVVLLAQTGDTKGQFRVTLDPADTAGMDPLDYRADVWAVLAGVRRCIVPPSVWPLRDPVTAPPP